MKWAVCLLNEKGNMESGKSEKKKQNKLRMLQVQSK